jgi:hypothetical protein
MTTAKPRSSTPTAEKRGPIRRGDGGGRVAIAPSGLGVDEVGVGLAVIIDIHNIRLDYDILTVFKPE